MRPTDKIHHSWDSIKYVFNTEKFLHFRNEILPNCISYPKKENIFNVFSTPLNKVKVVILGQDPYHGPNQATGLCFSVNSQIPISPSLRVIKKEILESSFNTTWGISTLLTEEKEWQTLEHWQQSGVFLLNTALTVESGKPGSHLKHWEYFTKIVISFLSTEQPCIWLLWGKKAQAYLPFIKDPFMVDKYDDETIELIPNLSRNYVFTASHPASEVYRENAGFLGCNHFRFANKILEKKNLEIINW